MLVVGGGAAVGIHRGSAPLSNTQGRQNVGKRSGTARFSLNLSACNHFTVVLVFFCGVFF